MIALWGELWYSNHTARWCLWAICVSGKILWNKCAFLWWKLMMHVFSCEINFGAIWCPSVLHCIYFSCIYVHLYLACFWFKLCIPIFVHIFSKKYFKWKLNKHLIVYLIKFMLCFYLAYIFFSVHSIKLKILVLMIGFITSYMNLLECLTSKQFPILNPKSGGEFSKHCRHSSSLPTFVCPLPWNI